MLAYMLYHACHHVVDLPSLSFVRPKKKKHEENEDDRKNLDPIRELEHLTMISWSFVAHIQFSSYQGKRDTSGTAFLELYRSFFFTKEIFQISREKKQHEKMVSLLGT